MENTRDKQININAYIKNSMNFIEVSDNGKGMSEEIKSQIFISFYTTKSEGDGIGLSLSRQIVLAHNGELNVNSELGKGSTFTIVI